MFRTGGFIFRKTVARTGIKTKDLVPREEEEEEEGEEEEEEEEKLLLPLYISSFFFLVPLLEIL